MKPVINESQKREIGALAVEHSDALIAMGADLYRHGFDQRSNYWRAWCSYRICGFDD